jgi:alpha-mannosidase
MLKIFAKRIVLLLVPLATLHAAGDKPDLTKEKTLYVVPYAHLDSQWRWTYVTTIDSWIKSTIDANLAHFEKYQDNVFTFIGSSRFEMMKEYYPEGFEKVKKLVKEGRSRVGGSSVDENDVNVPSPEDAKEKMKKFKGELLLKPE